MKRILSELVGLCIIGAVLFGAYQLNAATVETSQDTSATGPFGVKINTLDLTADRWTGWMRVDTKRTVCFDIALVDADSSVTSVDMRCETSRASTTVADAGYDVPVYVSTSAAGVTTSVPSTIRQTATGGGAPGSSLWTWCVTNIPGPFVECLFHGNGVPAAADTVHVYARGITP